MYIANYVLVSLIPDPGPNLELLTLLARFNNYSSNFCLFYRLPSSGSYIFDMLTSYFESVCAVSQI